MPVVVLDHRLKDFDTWFEQFSANLPPKIGRWWLARGIDDPNRVHFFGEVETPDVAGVKDHFASEEMRSILGQADAMSTAPVETIWLDVEEVTPS